MEAASPVRLVDDSGLDAARREYLVISTQARIALVRDLRDKTLTHETASAIVSALKALVEIERTQVSFDPHGP